MRQGSHGPVRAIPRTQILFIRIFACLILVSNSPFHRLQASESEKYPAPTKNAATRPFEAVETAKHRIQSQDLRGAQATLEEALVTWPEHQEIYKTLGEVLLDRCLTHSGTRSYEEAVRLAPNDPQALRGLTRAYLKGRNYLAANETLKRGFLVAPQDPELLTMKAKLLTHSRDYDSALNLLQRALTSAPNNPLVHSTLATIHFRLRDMNESRNSLIRTIHLEPNNTFAHHRLGTGSGVLARKYSRRERERINHLVKLGSLTLQAGDYEEARQLLSRGVAEFKLHYKLHHLLALALTELEFGRHALTNLPEFKTLFDLLPNPHVPDVDKIIVNFRELSPKERKVVRIAVSPFRQFVPALIRARATHTVLPLDDSITDLDHFEYLGDRTTFDHRHYAHVRGLGGLHAATGREYLQEAMDFRYNTLAHEFAHQVHLHAMSRDDRKSLEKIYERALKHDLPLDYYARSDVAEYFAQGYEAYVSFFKRPCLSSTAGHTREELMRRDPELFTFIQRLSSPTLTRGEWLGRLTHQIGTIGDFLGSEQLTRRALALENSPQTIPTSGAADAHSHPHAAGSRTGHARN